MRSIGEIFKENRERKKLSQDEIAKRLEVTKSYISKVENNIKKPTMEFLNRAAEVFDIDVLDFFEGKVKPDQTLSTENLEWVILGEEMKRQGVSAEQLREWVRAIKATNK
ncbi:helix-turn-helix domain-containing protein [Priestia flexa]|uniref:Helix-turn-helix transcriptional regulator n=1 Tax=Priestia flexa TaxID=86664 RepID=A0ABU4J237_9BACI|nr:helix-turn-helix transcriptional regulator [Priestia flexa]MDW8515064.1 helix-turn-helix transcriptional regulator [Priestia flexa]MEC0666343.1 helix-turn-helix transcriptional regulator [Priestia flexa]